MRLYEGLPEDCVEQCMELYEKSRVYSVEASIANEPLREPVAGSNSGTLWVIVKSIRLPSIDEVPVLNTVISSASSYRVEVYTYEEFGETDRASRLALLLEKGLSMGVPMVIVMPGLMGVALTSRMNRAALEALESSYVLEARLEYSNVLYLPLGGEIELVGKENSESSYERIEWLLGEAARRNVRVRGVKLLKDNREIWGYTVSQGARGLFERVPVNKISWLVAVLSSCAGIRDVQVLFRREKARHFIYILGLGRAFLDELLGGFKNYKNPTCTIPRELRGVVREGCKETLEELYRELIQGPGATRAPS